MLAWHASESVRNPSLASRGVARKTHRFGVGKYCVFATNPLLRLEIQCSHGKRLKALVYSHKNASVRSREMLCFCYILTKAGKFNARMASACECPLSADGRGFMMKAERRGERRGERGEVERRGEERGERREERGERREGGRERSEKGEERGTGKEETGERRREEERCERRGARRGERGVRRQREERRGEREGRRDIRL